LTYDPAIEAMIKAGLQPPGGASGGSGYQVPIQRDDKLENVPVEVGVYFALQQVAQQINILSAQIETLIRLESGAVSKADVRARIDAADTQAAEVVAERFRADEEARKANLSAVPDLAETVQ
jgi:hypothetical protein